MAKKLTKKQINDIKINDIKKQISDIKRLDLKRQIILLEQKIKKIPHFCNKCGQSCQIDNNESDDNYGLINAKVYGGYYSNKLEDGVGYSFSLCENCLAEMFVTFKINPEKTE